MSTIFICYRRSDSEDVTGRIYDRFVQSFRRSNIFKDVVSIPAGSDFREEIQKAIKAANVVVAVIGKGWLDAKLEDGSRRIDNPDDFVRIELETALEHTIPIVPVLLGGTKMPKAKELPVSLQRFAYLQGLPLRPDPDFTYDSGELVRALRRILEKKATPSRVWVFRAKVVAALLLLLAGILGLSFYLRLIHLPNSPNLPNSTKQEQVDIGPCVPGKRQSIVMKGIVYVRICQGSFRMGSDNKPPPYDDEGPSRKDVQVSEFWISETEITNKQYNLFRQDHHGPNNLPVVGVTWNEADAACKSFGGRLPTEAEWEYAARAGSPDNWDWSFGTGETGENMLEQYAWYEGNSRDRLHPVCARWPNSWGLYDMYGNAQEWVSDLYRKPYLSEDKIDPKGPKKGPGHVLRGGAFAEKLFPPENTRSAYRNYRKFGSPSDGTIGFRCCLQKPEILNSTSLPSNPCPEKDDQ